MGSNFTGIFLREGAVPIEAIEAAWPGCRVRRISQPFVGVGVAFASDDGDDDTGVDESSDSDYDADDAQRRVVAWSQLRPGQLIAYVAADCFGGICLYEGFTCLDGHVLDVVPLPRRGDGGLRRLLQPLGIELGPDEEFPPLRRAISTPSLCHRRLRGQPAHEDIHHSPHQTQCAVRVGPFASLLASTRVYSACG